VDKPAKQVGSAFKRVTKISIEESKESRQLLYQGKDEL